ncbi:MAG: flagellar filament capping protein FliD [Burkholderiales bacterium]|nr:flagellar filament capping protein FliD [Burkholderiales bacterium]
MPVSGTNFGAALDVNAIVAQLMTVERRPVAALEREQSAIQSRVSSWGRVKAGLGALREALRDLSDPQRLKPCKAQTANAAVATVAVGRGAAAGSHTLEVLALAQAHRLHSAPFASAGEAVGGGTLTFEFGNWDAGSNSFAPNPARPAQTVAIAPGATLEAVRDAVNAAGIGVSASIVDDGTASRLVFAAKETGAAYSLRITVADADGTHTDTAGLSRLAYDPAAAEGAGRNLVQASAAQDAQFRLDGVAMTRRTNTVADALAGVTLELRGTNPGAPIALTVERDGDAVKKAVERFVGAYNDALRLLRELTAYDPAARQGGLLAGDALAGALGSRMRAVLGAALAESAGRFRSLAEIGLAFQKDGSLVLEANRLSEAMQQAFDDIAGLLACGGSTDHPSLAFRGYSARTKPGVYAVEVTQPATRGTLTGSAAAGLDIVAGANDSLAVTVNGISATVTLAAGSYASAAALAAELQAKLNGAAPFSAAGVRVAVSESGGVLSIVSQRYGSGSTVAVSPGAAASTLFGDSPVAVGGTDVAGTIGGAAAVGSGRTLTGAAGTDAEGLAVEVFASAAGALGNVRFARGRAQELDQMIEALLAAGGAIGARLEGLNARLKTLARRKAEMEDRLADVERRYREQFVALDAMLARMNSTSSFLASQLAALPGARNR